MKRKWQPKRLLLLCLLLLASCTVLSAPQPTFALQTDPMSQREPPPPPPPAPSESSHPRRERPPRQQPPPPQPQQAPEHNGESIDNTNPGNGNAAAPVDESANPAPEANGESSNNPGTNNASNSGNTNAVTAPLDENTAENSNEAGASDMAATSTQSVPIDEVIASNRVTSNQASTVEGVAADSAVSDANVAAPAAAAASASLWGEARAAILTLIDRLHEPAAEHADQAELLALVQTGRGAEAFADAFEHGDELFETRFNSVDGVGANVGNGLRFSQLPRADLNGAGEWATHVPMRITGPNAEACNECHGTPMDDGAGPAVNNNVRDPLHSGDISLFIQRNTPHTFGLGAIQVLAEEMTEELHALREAAIASACSSGQAVTQPLQAKAVDFGALTVNVLSAEPCTVAIDASSVVGVNPDLIIRPFQWKGVVPTIRAFNRDAAHQELGMQSVEIVGAGVDGDFDGVVDELTVGDQTVLAVYLASQPRPTTQLELASLGLIDPLSAEAEAAIRRGEQFFDQIGCTTCHVAQLTIQDPIFYEPSQNPDYRDAQFSAGQDPVALGVDPAFPIAVNLTQDQPDNVIETDAGSYHLGSFPTTESGGALVALYGDLKRHDLGPEVAEPIDDEGIPASVFLTENLWGVGSTAPYLHDGRATTLAEAILAHGGEGAASRAAFINLDVASQADVIAFLQNLVLYKQ
ncbi:MAG: di-heme oxidoredictase family protein [Caldilineaceae bacterium]